VIIWTNCGVKDREAEKTFVNHKENRPSKKIFNPWELTASKRALPARAS
jgi:hypothetical protein